MAWVGPRPARRLPDAEVRGAGKGPARPVVAVLDTGTGEHPWFTGDVVVRDPEVLGIPIGPYPPVSPAWRDSERVGIRAEPLTGGLDPAAAHGTFIAGLVHQRCPDATVLSCRLYGGEGVIAEDDLLTGLRRLLLFHLLGLLGRPGYRSVDVVSLSLGYYHERPQDADFDGPFGALIDALRRHGVAVASAGNDSSTRPCYPAAFAPWLTSWDPPTPQTPATRPHHRGRGRCAQPGRQHRADEQRRAMGDVPAPGRGRREHHAHGPGRVADAVRRPAGSARARTSADHRPGRLRRRVRGVERDVVLGAPDGR